MEAGANTLAFVILAIKSAKLIHTVLRSIKDGPENVRRTADDVAALLSTLEQLSRCRALEKSECGPLEARLLRCVDDLEAFDGDIKRLEVGEGEGKRVRYWKRVKAAWGEKRIHGMRVVLSEHCAALDLQLSALQSDAVFDMSDQLRTINERLVSQKAIGEIPGQLRTITEELVSQRTVRETKTLLWREQQMISAQVSENVVGIRGGIDTIGKEVQAMSARYAARDTQIKERLDEILYQILNLKLEGQRESRVVVVGDELETGNKTRERIQGGYVQCHSTISAYNLGIATMIVSSRRRVRALNYRQMNTGIPSSSPPLEDVTTSITILPSEEMKVQQMFTLTTRRSDERHGVFLSIPVLCVNKVLPAGSPVFSIVKGGRLDEFMALLRVGGASIRDHDEYGASLLHYAAEGSQPAMCRVLIESGADVDWVASTRGVTGFHDNLLTPLVCTNLDSNHPNSDQDLACCRYLLDAGCDPTIPIFRHGYEHEVLEEATGDAFWYTFCLGDINLMRMMLDKANAFAGIQTVEDRAMTPLLVYCAYDNWQKEGFAHLLSHGASVRERCDDGDTCLHLCFRPIYTVGVHYDTLRRRDAILYLIEQGADVFARNMLGESVADVAYRRDELWGSFRGDVWDCAVANCGYDVSDFRYGRRRQAVYTRRYTRDDFDNLWAGTKHLCPYYDTQDDDIYLSDWSCYDGSDNDLASSDSDSDSEEGGVSI